MSLWSPPPGDYPESLWPAEHLKEIDVNPVGWLTVEQHDWSVDGHGGRGCVLVDDEEAIEALSGGTNWLGRELGEFAVWSTYNGEEGCENGLTGSRDLVATEFLVQVRKPSGSREPQIDVSLPFLWFWDAYESRNGWKYVSAAGREHDLIRYVKEGNSWKVEVRVHEFLAFLRVYGKCAVLQFDHVRLSPEASFRRVDEEFQDEWVSASFHAIPDAALSGEYSSLSRVCGRYILKGKETPRRPRWEEYSLTKTFPSFIIAVDDLSGQELTHTCNPDELGTYFDSDSSRVHYLTPVYFRRTVLQPYIAEPNRYVVTPFRISCLDIWGVDISINSAGLIEVYLGDIGRDIPPEEWGHWISHNVSPEGKMEEGRFRRDFLAQPASSPDALGDLRRARDTANEKARGTLGGDLWRPPPSDLAPEYRSLMGPLTDDSSALVGPVLILAKVFVDLMNVGLLKKSVQEVEENDLSLSILRRLLDSRGDTTDATKVLRDLYGVRSRGGVAHLSNSDSKRALANLGIDGLRPIQAFDHIVRQVTEAVTTIGDLLAP